MKRAYQGSFRFRSDNSALVDESVHKFDDEGELLRLIRNMCSYTKKVRGRLTRVPDLEQIVSETLANGPGCPDETASFGRIFFHWSFPAGKDPLDYGYKNLGREKLGDRDCPKVQFDALGKPMPKDNPVDIFWIDAERGCLPLKREYYRGQTLVRRDDEIQLRQFAGKDGKKVWFQYTGRDAPFGFNGRTDGRPLFIETNYIASCWGGRVLWPGRSKADRQVPDRPPGAGPTTAAR